MTTKQMVLEAVGQLPEDATFEQIQEQIQILARLRLAQTQIDQGQGAPHDQVRERVAGFAGQSVRHRDLDDLAGTWVADPAFDQAIAQLHRVD